MSIIAWQTSSSDNLFTADLTLAANRTHNLDSKSLRFNGATNAGIMINSDFTGSALIGALNSIAASAIHGVSWNTNGYGVIGSTAIGFNGRGVLGTAQNGNLAIGVEGQASGSDISIGFNSVVTSGTTRYTFYGVGGSIFNQALNGNSGERVIGLRNHTNTGWLFDLNNDGSGGFRVDNKLIYFGSGSRILTGADANTGWLLNFGLYACKLTTLLDGGNQDISNLNQIAFQGAYDTDARTLAYSNKGSDPTSGVALTYKQYGKVAGPVATNVVPHFYIYDYITPANSYTIQFFKGAPMTASDGTLANAVLRIAELEAKLTAYGLL